MNVKIEDIRPIFLEVLGSAAATISEKTTAQDVEGWDSFAHISIVVATEEKYGVTFSTEELGSMTCIGDFLSLLDNKLTSVR
jgi:acyl carrier protein